MLCISFNCKQICNDEKNNIYKNGASCKLDQSASYANGSITRQTEYLLDKSGFYPSENLNPKNISVHNNKATIKNKEPDIELNLDAEPKTLKFKGEQYELELLKSQPPLKMAFKANHSSLENKPLLFVIIINKNTDSENNNPEENQINILKKIRPSDVYSDTQQEGQRIIVTKYYNEGNLRNALREGITKGNKKENLVPEEQTVIALKLIEEINTLHEAQCIHRDIKPENTVLHIGKNNELSAYLIDFDSACNFSSELTKQTKLTDLGTTMAFWAPECGKHMLSYLDSEASNLAAEFPATTETDIWALGATLFELFQTPSTEEDDENPNASFSGRLVGELSPEEPANTPKKYSNLLAQVTQDIVDKIIDQHIDSAKGGIKNLLKSMLCVDPEKRCIPAQYKNMLY